MVSVVLLYLRSDIPVVGCELTPYVRLKRADKSEIHDDVTEFNPIDGCFLRYKWYRIQSDKEVAVCSVHPTEPATLQCIGCLKAKLPVTKSYHCTSKCFHNAWNYHCVLHERAASAVKENRNELEEIYGSINSTNTTSGVSMFSPQSKPSLPNSTTPLYPIAAIQKDGETWYEVGCSKAYTPTADDVGHALTFKCFVVDAQTKLCVGPENTLLTSRVIPAPLPRPRRMISFSANTLRGHLDSDARVSSSGTFKVLSYNILCDSYATSDLYSYCPSWALSWTYRKHNLLREIVGYQADIICLQEVQVDHFEKFFAPELGKHGYEALFKRKTSEVSKTIDGCATFFLRDRFSHVKKYEVEFNKAAQFLTNTMVFGNQRKNVLDRLAKDNIALIAVLEAKFSNQGNDYHGKGQFVCVANTHVSVDQELTDVKLWQVNTLLKALEKIASIEDIPILLCGDFSSVPGSAPHSLLAMGKVDPQHPDLKVDPFGILWPLSKLTHQLPLISAYSSFARGGDSLAIEHKRRVDLATNEPLFTNYTRDFTGTNDYIFYSADILKVESLLELLGEDSLRKNTALPSPEWSSDHIALLAEFRCKLSNRRLK